MKKFAFAVLTVCAMASTGCGGGACDELAECVGTENPGGADEATCQTALDLAKSLGTCKGGDTAGDTGE